MPAFSLAIIDCMLSKLVWLTFTLYCFSKAVNASGLRYWDQLKYSRSPSIWALGKLVGGLASAATGVEVCPHAIASHSADPPRPRAAEPLRKSRRLTSLVQIFEAIGRPSPPGRTPLAKAPPSYS